jgi:hypothetical protein
MLLHRFIIIYVPYRITKRFFRIYEIVVPVRLWRIMPQKALHFSLAIRKRLKKLS